MLNQTGFYASLLFLVGVVSGLIITYRWKRNKIAKSLASIPSPPQHWLLGNIPQVLAAVRDKKYFQLLFDWSQELGSIYVFWGSKPVVVLSKPRVIEETIINGMKDGSLVRTKGVQKAWNDISGSIMLGQEGKQWQWRRRAWTPKFNPTGLAKYIKIIDRACSQVIHKIEATETSKSIEVDSLFVELTMKVICYLMLGIPLEQKKSTIGSSLDIQKVYTAMSVVGYRFLRVAIGEKTWQKYLPTKSSRDYWSARRYLETFLSPYVDLALQLRESDRTPPEIGSEFRESMLVTIASREPNYSRETLISEAIEILIAGTDTTAHTLSFAVGELASNPRVFEKAQSIADRVFSSSETLNLSALEELSYIRAIVKETLRLYSVASGSTSLQATRETTVAGITIPCGTKVFWSMLGAGRDSETYSQPEEFLPERWLEGEGSNSLPMINFGSGYHRCLGEHLALLEATIMLAQLLRHFDWELVNGRSSLENLQQNLLIYPVDGMPLRLRSRSQISIQKNQSAIG